MGRGVRVACRAGEDKGVDPQEQPSVTVTLDRLHKHALQGRRRPAANLTLTATRSRRPRRQTTRAANAAGPRGSATPFPAQHQTTDPPATSGIRAGGENRFTDTACTPNVLSAPAQRPSSLILKAILHFVLPFRTDCPAQHYLCTACAHWARTLSEQEGGQTRQAWTCDTCPNCLQTERLVMASAGDVETTSTYTVIRLITFLPFCLPNHTNK